MNVSAAKGKRRAAVRSAPTLTPCRFGNPEIDHSLPLLIKSVEISRELKRGCAWRECSYSSLMIVEIAFAGRRGCAHILAEGQHFTAWRKESCSGSTPGRSYVPLANPAEPSGRNLFPELSLARAAVRKEFDGEPISFRTTNKSF